MSYTVNIDNFDQAHWQQTAKEFADYSIYQTWPYQENRAERSGCKISRAIITDENGQASLMCHVRIMQIKATLLKIGYVQWGPVVRSHDNEIKCTVAALTELRKAYLDNMVNVLRFVPNMVNNEMGADFIEMLKAAGFHYSNTFAPYRTLAIKFENGEEGIRKGMSSNFRRTLKNAEKSGLQVHQKADDEGFSVLADMYKVLKERKGFSGLDIEEFNVPQKLLSDDEKMDLVFVYNQDRPVSTVLSSNLGDSGLLLLAAANQEGLDLGGSYLTWFSSAVHSLNSGKQVYDLGGIDPVNNPGVYSFKSRMGGIEQYHIGAFDACKNSSIKMMWNISDKARAIINHH